MAPSYLEKVMARYKSEEIMIALMISIFMFGDLYGASTYRSCTLVAGLETAANNSYPLNQWRLTASFLLRRSCRGIWVADH